MHDGGWWSYIRYEGQEHAPRVSRALLQRILRYVLPYRGMVALMLVAMVGITFLSLVPPLLFRDLIDNALPQHDVGRLNLLAVAMVLIPLVSGALGLVQRWMSAQIGEGIISDLRVNLFAHLQRMSLRFFTNTRTGELMSRLNNDVVGAQRAVSQTLVDIVANLIAVVSVLSIMLVFEWRLTILALLLLPLFILPARRVGDLLRRIIRRQMTLNAEMNALMNETLNVAGALLVKLFGRAQDENERMAARARAVRDAGVEQAVIARGFFVVISLTSAFGTAIVFWVGGQLVLSGAFTVGTIVAFSTYLGQLYGPLTALTNSRLEFVTSLVSFERVFEVLDLPVDITDRPGAQDLGVARGHVRFEDVSFSYGGRAQSGGPGTGLAEVMRFGHPVITRTLSGATGPGDANAGEDGGGTGTPEDLATAEPAIIRYAVEHVSFEVQPGQLAALVGHSGAGKTTITYLLPRLYDVTGGRIEVDGHDLRDLTLKSLSANIGMVTQETYLFHDTIRANLLYARPHATQTELEAASRAANIHEFIHALPDGYDTVVGERGYRLSGGEKQRVAIARVILKDPRLLILDEATSALDSQTEALIQEALQRVMHGRTSLVIAHRLSTILAADVILVMDRGRLVEQGTHRDLLARGGVYAGLYHTQYRKVGERPVS